MSEPILDFDAFLPPISEDEPAGPVLYDIRQQLDEMRREREDPTNPGMVVKPNWRDVIKLAQDTLVNRSKDLIVAARLTEALMQTYGYGGLRDGLRLIRLLVEQAWERVNPLEDPEDAEVRGLPFVWLANPDQRPFFPGKVRMLALFGSRDMAFSYRDWEQLRRHDDPERKQQFDTAVDDTSTETLESLATDIGEASEEVNTLDGLLGERMGDNRPGLDGLRTALKDCAILVEEKLAPRRPPDQTRTADTQGGAAGETPRTGGLGVGSSVATRAEAYQRLKEIAYMLRQMEPHSPIPYLLDKAVEWGGLPFPQLIAALIRDAAVLGEINREFGIKEEG